jgi:hypothetical protein
LCPYLSGLCGKFNHRDHKEGTEIHRVFMSQT